MKFRFGLKFGFRERDSVASGGDDDFEAEEAGVTGGGEQGAGAPVGERGCFRGDGSEG